MRHLLEISRTGLDAVLLHPLRSLVCVLALVVVLLPYLTGLGLAHGLQHEAESAAVFGADLYVSGTQFGRPAPLPLEAAEQVRKLGADENATVVPRVVGAVVLGKDRVHAVLIGLPSAHFPAWVSLIEGELPRVGGPHQLVIGTTLARRLGLGVGSLLPPFYRNDRQGERTSRVVGIFKPQAPLWQSSLILTTLETASSIFDQPGMATDLLVWCRPGYQTALSRSIAQKLAFPSADGRGIIRPRVTTREDLLALLPRNLRHLEGIFNLHFLLAFVVGILVLVVTSGVGLIERRREIGILKATGWQTDEVLLRGLVESLVLALTAACLALLLAWVWLRLLNARWIAGLVLAGVEARPDFPVPFRLAPVPALLAFVLSLVIVLTGTLYSSWRAATAAPREAMR